MLCCDCHVRTALHNMVGSFPMTKVLTTVSQAMLEDTPLTSRHLLAAVSRLFSCGSLLRQSFFSAFQRWHQNVGILAFGNQLLHTFAICMILFLICVWVLAKTCNDLTSLAGLPSTRFWWRSRQCFILPFLPSRSCRSPKRYRDPHCCKKVKHG